MGLTVGKGPLNEGAIRSFIITPRPLALLKPITPPATANATVTTLDTETSGINADIADPIPIPAATLDAVSLLRYKSQPYHVQTTLFTPE